MTANTSPLESDEQATFVEWLESIGLRFTAIPNSTYTKSWAQKAKNHREGLRPGLCDMLVLIPPELSNDGLGHSVYIEMKRQRGGVVSTEQKSWISALNQLDSPNVDAVVCKGAVAAIETVLSYVNYALIEDSPF